MSEIINLDEQLENLLLTQQIDKSELSGIDQRILDLEEFETGEYKEDYIRKYKFNQESGKMDVEYISKGDLIYLYIDFCVKGMKNGEVDFRLDEASEKLNEFQSVFFKSL